MEPKQRTAHPWHGLTPGDNCPEEVTAFIEVPKNSMLKYELDKDTGLIKLDRVLYSAVHFPGDYGFIPQTLSEDGDATDVIVLSNFPLVPGVITKIRPIGVIEMIDQDERDEKIIAVHSTDPRFENHKDISNVSEHILLEVKHFFETYKALQNKEVKILSVKGVEEAHKEIQAAINKYKEVFSQ